MSGAAGVVRLVVTGSECTGKTTLARALAERLGVAWVPEFARRHAESRAGALDANDVEPIARGQIAAEDAALASAAPCPGIVVLDTDLVSTVVYARHYYGECPAWIEREARQRLAELYLLCDIDVPWRADGVRDRPQHRAALHEAFAATLADFGARVTLVRGDGLERLARALREVDAALTRF